VLLDSRLLFPFRSLVVGVAGAPATPDAKLPDHKAAAGQQKQRWAAWASIGTRVLPTGCFATTRAFRTALGLLSCPAPCGSRAASKFAPDGPSLIRSPAATA